MFKAFSVLVACSSVFGVVQAQQSPPKPTEMVVVAADGGEVWDIFGLRIVGKLSSEQTGGDYSVVVSTTPPGNGPPLHVHSREAELFQVLVGEYEFRFGEQTVTVAEGAMVHLPPGIPHTFKNISDSPGQLMNVITPGGFEAFFRDIDQLPKDAPPDRALIQEIAARYGLEFLPPGS